MLESLHKEGDFRGSFGHAVYDGGPEVVSPVIFPRAALEPLKAARLKLGPAELSAMPGISGMSFPQLSAQSHLSLIYMHLKLAKEQNAPILYDTGEGGPGFALAMLGGDGERAKRELIAWNRAEGRFSEGSLAEAKLVALVDAIMAKRAGLFSEFSPEDLARAQVVAQFGSAMNGARGDEGRVDFDKLRTIAASPFVVMTQFKLKQAAKRGAKVDAKKVDDIVAALRDLKDGLNGKFPEVAPDLDSHESIAALIKAAKLVTGKPVSLKFGVGDAKGLHDLLRFLKGANALPDHIQLDGRGDDFSPGSGSAPPAAATSLPADEAIIVADAVLKKLGVRDRIVLEATGDLLLPTEGVKKLALGADCLSGGRLWMGWGLGCAMVRSCADGNCPYGIAARSDSAVGLGPGARRRGRAQRAPRPLLHARIHRRPPARRYDSRRGRAPRVRAPLARPVAQALQREREEDGVEPRHQRQALDPVDADAERVDEDPDVPVLEDLPSHEDLGHEARDRGQRVEIGKVGRRGERRGPPEMRARHDEAQGRAARRHDRGRRDELEAARARHGQFPLVSGVARLLAHPQPPAPEDRAEIIDLLEEVGVEARAVEQDGEEDHARQPDGPVPDAAASHQPHAEQVEGRPGPFERAHAAMMPYRGSRRPWASCREPLGAKDPRSGAPPRARIGP